MNKLLKALVCCLVVLSMGCGKSSPKEEVVVSNQKAMWFSFLDYQAFDLEKSLEEQIEEVVSNTKELGCNSLYVHCIAFTDAYYNSTYYPHAQVAKDQDPFSIFVKKAHEEGLQVFAWCNPMRSIKVEDADNYDDSYTGAKIIKDWITYNSEQVRPVKDRYYLNPAYEEVLDLIQGSVKEILDLYPVDGVVLDDYFYPEGCAKNFDSYIYQKENQDQEESLEAFRTQNINRMVKRLDETCHSYGVPFGISVAGNLENNLSIYMANPYDWCANGWVDFLAPQIYWGFEHPIKPFTETLQQWKKVSQDVPLCPALAAYKIQEVDTYAQKGANEWVEHEDMLANMVKVSYQNQAKGISLFRYGSLYPESNKQENEIKHLQAELKVH